MTSRMPPVEPDDPIHRLDAAVAEAMVPHADDTGVGLLGAISDLSDQEPLYAASAAVMAVGAAMGDGPTWRAGTRILAAHLVATALRGVVKQLVDRTRPEAAARKGEYVLDKGAHKDSDFNSFPSGHTAGAVAVARALSRDYAVTGPAMTIASLAGVAQVVRSKHFVSDVVAGAAIGLIAEAMVDRLINRFERI